MAFSDDQNVCEIEFIALISANKVLEHLILSCNSIVTHSKSKCVGQDSGVSKRLTSLC